MGDFVQYDISQNLEFAVFCRDARLQHNILVCKK